MAWQSWHQIFCAEANEGVRNEIHAFGWHKHNFEGSPNEWRFNEVFKVRRMQSDELWHNIPHSIRFICFLNQQKNFFAHYLDNLWLFWASCILAFVSIFKLFEGRCSVVNNNERLFWGLWEVIMGGGLSVEWWGYNNNNIINNKTTTTISFSCLNEQ